MNARAPKEVVKEASMLKQKEMIAGNYAKLATAKEQGKKVVSTVVPASCAIRCNPSSVHADCNSAAIAAPPTTSGSAHGAPTRPTATADTPDRRG